MRAREFTINIPINIKINGDGEPDISVDQEEETPLDSDNFMPPLQTKIELLKKSVGQEPKNSELADDEPLE